MARISYRDQARAVVGDAETVEEAVEALVAAGWRPGKGSDVKTAEDAAAALARRADLLREPPSYGALQQQAASYAQAATLIRNGTLWRDL